MVVRRGPVRAGEKVQLTDRKGKMLTIMLQAGAITQTDRGFLTHDLIIGQTEGTVIHTVSVAELKEIQQADSSTNNHSVSDSSQASENTNVLADERSQRKPWKSARSSGGWAYTMMRPRLVDYTLSMPRGAQIMYPKDIAQVISIGDIRSGMRVLESGAGSGAMSIALLDAVGEAGTLTTVEMRPEFARVAQGNATVYFGQRPSWWRLLVGSFDEVVPTLTSHSFDRVVLDQLDPWNRLDSVWQALVPGGVLTAYITTTTQLSRLAEALRSSGQWTEPEMVELLERGWKADGLAVRPQHQMIGHTGFLLVTRSMALGNQAMRKRTHATKDLYTDVDQRPDQTADSETSAAMSDLSSLELRDISDRKLRKVLRDLEQQERQAIAAQELYSAHVKY
ncbi:methyltransferase [Bombiscardovia apis]|uniref:tRNA (adenine(58)-N(1))-methyltransferase TrmI n=1 Tax=Bombiscardovia apis TaxID=2932182 RepID=A0ABM8BCV0_9BIFI|nr:tRNA (adenine-N1)-methyltransferase [Bombiscardovia apis]BDR54724.1 methyltransferase [Bombiscardovia apis]